MNRLVFILALAFVLAVGGMALAYDPRGEALPSGAINVDVWKLVDNQFVKTDDARSWNSNGTGGHCNRLCHETELTTHVSVAQWIKWTLSATRKDFRVLKPGTYRSNSWTANVKSNNDVEVTFTHDNLGYLNPDPDALSPDIAIRHGYSSDGNHPEAVTAWVAADDTPITFTIPFADVSQPGGADYHIWQEITVENNHRSSEYEGSGTVLICITNQKFWVDEGGNWAEDQFGQPPSNEEPA